MTRITRRLSQFVALALILLLGVGPVMAGITISGADGIMISGADGVNYHNTSGIMASGADGYLAFGPNGIMASGADGIMASGADGIMASGADGIMASGADGIMASGADGVTYTGSNGIMASGADGIMISGADGIMASGADGIMISGADGTKYSADSIIINQANGIKTSGADTVRVVGANGIMASGADGIMASGADGIMASGADGIMISGADSVTVFAPNGDVFNISPNGITITGADTLTVSNPAGIAISGADSIVRTGLGQYTALYGQTMSQSGLQSVDPELALQLDRMTDDSNVNAIVVFHRYPSESDIADLQRIGVLAGTLYSVLPMVTLTATRHQLFAISHLSSVRSIYGNRTLQMNMDQRLAVNGVDRARRDADLVRNNSGQPVTGRGVTVAVLDTGLDGTHDDLAGRVVQNVKLADTQSAGAGFTPPAAIENVPNTDQAYGHGTFVAGVIAGSGARSGSKYNGVAPGARVVGLSAGDLTLSFVLSGFDYLLSHARQQNVRVVNCSFSANSVFDLNDPVNVATKMLTDSGVSVVFSAGNTGDGLHTLNPYAVAPWVISVGGTDERGRLAKWSSRGDFGSSLFRPTLVAPGVNVISLRSSGVSLTGTTGAAGADTQLLNSSELPYYTTASGTSFSAPQVAGSIALMLEANPSLAPAQIKDILQRTATPLPSYYQHEVGAGMLNAHAAVLEAAFAQRRMGTWRASLDRGQVRFVSDPWQEFKGTVNPGLNYELNAAVPEHALFASVQVAWPLLSLNDLTLSVYDPNKKRQDGGDTVSLPGLTGKRERVMVKLPASGSWNITVSNMLGAVGTPQNFNGVLEITRAEYAPLKDLGGLGQTRRADIYQALRMFFMFPQGNNFRPDAGVSRGDLAATLVMAGRVPQYMPSQPSYTDVRDRSMMNFVESVQAAPNGPLFTDAAAGGQFRPNNQVDRVTAAVVLVRAAGLEAEAQGDGQPKLLALTDLAGIPTDKRGYVAVALSRGLLSADGGAFRPQGALTRSDLAHAMVLMTNSGAR
jgi:serine protease AprX